MERPTPRGVRPRHRRDHPHHARDRKVAAWLRDTAKALEEIGEIDLAIDWARQASRLGPWPPIAASGRLLVRAPRRHRPDDVVGARLDMFRSVAVVIHRGRLHRRRGQVRGPTTATRSSPRSRPARRGRPVRPPVTARPATRLGHWPTASSSTTTVRGTNSPRPTSGRPGSLCCRSTSGLVERDLVDRRRPQLPAGRPQTRNDAHTRRRHRPRRRRRPLHRRACARPTDADPDYRRSSTGPDCPDPADTRQRDLPTACWEIPARRRGVSRQSVSPAARPTPGRGRVTPSARCCLAGRGCPTGRPTGAHATGTPTAQMGFRWARRRTDPSAHVLASLRTRQHATGPAHPYNRLHDVRHTHATLLLKEHVTPKVVTERFGPRRGRVHATRRTNTCSPACKPTPPTPSKR